MDLSLFIPEIALAVFILIVILLDLVTRRKRWLAVVSILGLVVSAGLSMGLWNSASQSVFNDMLAVDNFAVFFKMLFAGIGVLVVLASSDYVSHFKRFQGEYYALIMLATLGMMLMASASELISLFISLELVNISLYSLVGFLKNQKGIEASLKYLILSAIASTLLLFGMAFVYGFTGETQLALIARNLQAMSLNDLLAAPGLIVGVLLMLVGFGFKIGMVPFQMWIPDVYEGAPTPIAAFLSVGSKAAGFAIILRVFSTAFGLPGDLSHQWGIVIAVLAAVTMSLGNILAIQQTNIKRLLGYSSIAQAGYLIVGLAAVAYSSDKGSAPQSSLLFFLLGYALTNLAAFISIIAISYKINAEELSDYSGIAKRSPWMAAVFTLSLISLIGLPPAAGFMAKFYVFSSAVNAGLLWLVIIAVINSVISSYYYLRIVKIMWTGEPTSNEKIESSPALLTALTICGLGILILGILPDLGIHITDLARMLGL